MPLALIPAAIGAAGAVGAGIAAAKGVGLNKTAATNFGQSDQYDRNQFFLDGDPNRARQIASYYDNQGREALGQADLQYGNQNAARGAQDQAAGLMMARATGAVPSIAGQQANIDAQRAMAAQASMAASARGQAGLALAGQQAANNTAQAQAAISNQAQVNAANERLQAEQAAYGAYSGMRGGDLAAQQNMQQQGLASQQNAMATRQQQLQAGIAQQGLLAGSYDSAQGQNQARLQANANKGLQWFQAGLGAAQGGAQGAMSMVGGKK